MVRHEQVLLHRRVACSFHGSEGRGADIPSDVPAEYFDESLRRPYPRESEHSDPWPWVPPVEMRPAGRVREQRPRPALSPELVAVFDRIDAYKSTVDGVVRYAVRIRWRGCGWREEWVYAYRSRAERRVAQVEKQTSHWTKTSAKGAKRKKHDDEPEVTVEPYFVPMEFVDQTLAEAAEAAEAAKIPCECCGEMFLPTRPWQTFVNRAHKQRAYRERSHLG